MINNPFIISEKLEKESILILDIMSGNKVINIISECASQFSIQKANYLTKIIHANLLTSNFIYRNLFCKKLLI